MPDWNVNFCSKFAFKTLASGNWWHRESKVSSYIICHVFGSHAGQLWIKSYGQKCIKFIAFLKKKKKKTSFSKPFLTYCWRHSARRFCSWNNHYLMDQLSIFRLLSFSASKIMVVRQVKLKLAPKMPGLISMKHSVSSLKFFA